MLRTEPLTRDDLDEIGRFSLHSITPLDIAGELIDVVERGQLEDMADAGYALLLAAEIHERAGDIAAAAALADRAVAAYRRYDDQVSGYSRGYRAELLFKLGRGEEALAEFAALRPLLALDANAVEYLTEMLTACGRHDLAMHWVTDALRDLLGASSGEGVTGGALAVVCDDTAAGAGDEAAVVAYALAQRRRSMREGSGLPADDLDLFADRLRDELQTRIDDQDDPGSDEGTAVLFWPHREFEQVLRRWPSLARVYGRDWDDHRSRLEHALTMYADAGHTGLTLLTGIMQELADHLAEIGASAEDHAARQGYVERLAERQHGAPWPPARNDPCWCGANVRYKRCCQRRTRR